MKIILSIDGGGIRGIVPAAILDYLEKKIQEIQKDSRIKIGSLIDIVAGTSTGSIVGSLMLLPCPDNPKSPRYTMQEITEMYVGLGPKIFRKHLVHNLKTIWGLFGPQFPASNIEDPLIQILGHQKMKDLVRPCLFTGYDINKRKINIYTNKDENRKYENYYLKDIIRGSTSIPAYFPPAYFRDGVDINTVIDGGVFSNNPAMVAYIEASKTIFRYQNEATKLGPHDMIVISLGTGKGKKQKYHYNKVKRYGKAQWLFPVIDILLSGSSEVVDYEMQKLFQAYDRLDNYKRINPPLNFSTDPATDASKKNITNLLKDVSVYIRENEKFLNTLAREICDLNYLIPH